MPDLRRVSVKPVTRIAWIVAILLGLTAARCLAETITLSSSDYPPYFGPGLPQEGIATAITVAALQRAGDTVVIRYRPWARALDEANEGTTDGVIGLWHSAERERYLAYSQSFFTNKVGFYARRDRMVDVRDLSRLKPLRIGVVHGYHNPAAFSAANLTSDEAPDDEHNLIKLAQGRVDLILIDKGVADWLLAGKLRPLRAALVWLEPGVEIMPAYVAFSRQSPGWERRLNHFNSGLEALRKDGTLARLFRTLAH